MFVYKVKSPNSLISYISLNNQYITFWKNPLRENDLISHCAFRGAFFEILTYGHQIDNKGHSIYHGDLEITDQHLHNVLNNGMSDAIFKELIFLLRKVSTKAGFQRSVQSLPTFFEKASAFFPVAQDEEDAIIEASKSYIPQGPCFPQEEIKLFTEEYQNYQKKRKLSDNLFKDHAEKIENYIFEIESFIEKKQIHLMYILPPEKDLELQKNTKNLIKLLRSIQKELNDKYSNIDKINTIITQILTEEKNAINLINEKLATRLYKVKSLDDYLNQLKSDLSNYKSIMKDTFASQLSETKPFKFVSRLAKTSWGSLKALKNRIVKDPAYRHDAYQTVKADPKSLNKPQKRVFLNAAASSKGCGKGVFNMFSRANWDHQKAYYAGQTAAKFHDVDLIQRVKRSLRAG